MPCTAAETHRDFGCHSWLVTGLEHQFLRTYRSDGQIRRDDRTRHFASATRLLAAGSIRSGERSGDRRDSRGEPV
jgi:hypothetical protein